MDSISVKTGKKFTGRFASLAVKIGLASPSGENTEEKAPVEIPDADSPVESPEPEKVAKKEVTPKKVKKVAKKAKK
jgi:hypothetical protein